MKLPFRMRNLGTNETGATLAEFAILMPVLVLIIFAIVELSSVMWQRQLAEFATSRALRIATTRLLIPDGTLPDCGVNTTLEAGTRCNQVAGSEGWAFTCTPASPGICNGAILQRMMDEITNIAPNVAATNLVVEVEGVGLGFVGRGRPVPLITVTLSGLGYDFIALGNLVGMGNLVMADVAASAPAEDLRGL